METFEHLALFSIKPIYAQSILSEVKRVEFRKTRLLKPISGILIYETNPTMKVVGIAHVKCVVGCSPTETWNKFGSQGGIRKADFFKYFDGSDMAYTFVLGHIVKFRCPAELSELGLGATAPQSFRYVGDAKLILHYLEKESVDIDMLKLA